jgi:hypothetical protein
LANLRVERFVFQQTDFVADLLTKGLFYAIFGRSFHAPKTVRGMISEFSRMGNVAHSTTEDHDSSQGSQ